MASLSLTISAVSANDLQEAVLELARLFPRTEVSPAALAAAVEPPPPVRAGRPRKNPVAPVGAAGGPQAGQVDPRRGEIAGTLADDLSAAAHSQVAGDVQADPGPSEDAAADEGAAGGTRGGASGQLERGEAAEGEVAATEADAQAGAPPAGSATGQADPVDGGAGAGGDAEDAPHLEGVPARPGSLGEGADPGDGAAVEDHPHADAQAEAGAAAGTAGGVEISGEQMTEALRSLLAKVGHRRAKELLDKHGVAKPSAVPEDKRPALYADVMKELG